MTVLASYGSVPVHVITLYLPFNDTEVANYTVRLVKWFVSQIILKKNPNSYIIFA
jgi:hypothetical protein